MKLNTLYKNVRRWIALKYGSDKKLEHLPFLASNRNDLFRKLQFQENLRQRDEILKTFYVDEELCFCEVCEGERKEFEMSWYD